MKNLIKILSLSVVLIFAGGMLVTSSSQYGNYKQYRCHTCYHCQGFGSVKCSMCQGKGTAWGNDCTCPSCKGRGYKLCYVCKGRGEVCR